MKFVMCSKKGLSLRQYVPRPHQHDYTMTDIIMKKCKVFIYFFVYWKTSVYLWIFKMSAFQNVYNFSHFPLIFKVTRYLYICTELGLVHMRVKVGVYIFF